MHVQMIPVFKVKLDVDTYEIIGEMAPTGEYVTKDGWEAKVALDPVAYGICARWASSGRGVMTQVGPQALIQIWSKSKDGLVQDIALNILDNDNFSLAEDVLDRLHAQGLAVNDESTGWRLLVNDAAVVAEAKAIQDVHDTVFTAPRCVTQVWAISAN